MKKLLLLLLVGLTFTVCAIIGFTLSNRLDQAQHGTRTAVSAGASAVENAAQSGSEQYRLIILYVDQLDNPHPALLSTWYVSLFFLEGAPTLTFAQVYPNPKNERLSAQMQKAFVLDAQGNPEKGFWKSLDSLGLDWDSFVIIDRNSAQTLLEWANGPGSYAALFDAPNEHPTEIQQVLTTSCRQVAGMDSHPKEGFAWAEIVPAHFRSDLRMEVAIAHWDSLVKSSQPARCEVLLAR